MTQTFIGYEYKEVLATKNQASLYTDGYLNFGWELDSTSSAQQGLNHVNLKFKRDRKIPNKPELIRLQRQYDTLISDISHLEKQKSILASTLAYGIGVVGTIFMAGSVFAITASPANTALCIILAIPGFIGWVIPYLIFSRIKQNKTRELTPDIDSKYDELYEVSLTGSKLLTA